MKWLLVLLMVLVGCASVDAQETVPPPVAEEKAVEEPPVVAPPAAPIEVQPEPEESLPEPTPPPKEEKLDVDLTILSSTMVYAEVYNMMLSPVEYVGKRIRIRGQYQSGYDNLFDVRFHFVVIADATACCAEGIEIIVEGDLRYPEDYPENGVEVEVTGIYEGYDLDGATAFRLRTDAITIVQN